MKVYGYSERGILNSLIYEIRYANNGAALFDSLISKATFPLTDNKPSTGDSTVLVEQSLSQFGEADAIILTSSNSANCTVFVEAKVLSQAQDWQLSNEFNKFEDGLNTKVNSSNIFAQLYHKQRLVSVLTSDGIEALQQGVDFPSWSTNQRRKVGPHPVVLNSLNLIRRCNDNVYYLMLVPDTHQRVESFFENRLRNLQLPAVPDWDPSHYGFLTWATVKSFCKRNRLAATLAVFAYNQGQIFPENAG